MKPSTPVLKKNSLVVIDCDDAGVYIRRITAIKITPDGVTIDLAVVGPDSDRRWAKKKGSMNANP